MEEIEITRLTAQVVGAFAANNRLAAADLPALITAIRQSLGAAIAPEPEPPAQVKKPTPTRIRQSIQPDALPSCRLEGRGQIRGHGDEGLFGECPRLFDHGARREGYGRGERDIGTCNPQRIGRRGRWRG